MAWTIAIPAAIRRGQETLAIVFGPDKPPADFATKGGGLLGLRPKNFIGGSEDVIGAAVDLPKMVERYSSLTVPIAILFGTNDGILNYESNGTTMQKKVSGLTLELVPGGHMLPVTAPKETAEFIKAAACKLAIKGDASASCLLVSVGGEKKGIHVSARRSLRKILPTFVCGSVSRKRTSFGTL